jgi:uncharacterized phage protein (TIGR01671 family)
MRAHKYRLVKDGKIVGYERCIFCNQREGYVKGKSLVPQHSKDGICWEYIYKWEMKTRPKGYWFEARLDKDIYIDHDSKDQFTGKFDDDKKEICQDDILEYHDILSDEYLINRSQAKKTIGQVSWFEERCQYMPQEIKKNHKDGHYIAHWDNIINVKIIGNIHDNKELLEK